MAKTALQLAYEGVSRHLSTPEICDRFALNKRTVYRIRDGLEIKSVTQHYCMRAFLIDIYAQYRADLSAGGTHSRYFHDLLIDILFAMYEIDRVHLHR